MRNPPDERKRSGCRSGCPALLAARRADVALADELLADLGEIALRLGAAELLEHRVKVGKLRRRLGNMLRELLLGRAGL